MTVHRISSWQSLLLEYFRHTLLRMMLLRMVVVVDNTIVHRDRVVSGYRYLYCSPFLDDLPVDVAALTGLSATRRCVSPSKPLPKQSYHRSNTRQKRTLVRRTGALGEGDDGGCFVAAVVAPTDHPCDYLYCCLIMHYYCSLQSS